MWQQAWDLLKNNKEWLFSGAGVIIILAVLAWFRKAVIDLFRYLYCKLRSSKAPQKLSIAEAMAKTHILFVDDDTKFKVVTILKTAGWEHTTITKDIASLTDSIVTRTDIFFIDINGVGKKIGFRDEGLGLALALKQRYPDKRVIIYSADQKAEWHHEAWKVIDTNIPKNADPYQFQQVVEEYALNKA